MKELPEILKNLSPEMLELLARKLKKVPAKEVHIPLISRKDQDIPLSYSQQRLWFLDKLEGPNPNYNLSFGLWLRGHFQADILERCLNEIARRHEILRTCFAEKDGQPIQVIKPASGIPLLIMDLVAASVPITVAQRLADLESRHVFQLSSGPLLRACLMVLSPGEHVLLLCMHHIISDGWSREVLVHELISLYQAFLAGDASPLPELKVQFADFSHWLRAQLTPEILKAQRAFWVQYLADVPELHGLPTDFSRPAVLGIQGGLERVNLPVDLVLALKSHARDHQASLFMCLQAAFLVFLHKYSGRDDIVVGSPIANRDHPDQETMIGFFVNTLPLRFHFARDPAGNPVDPNPTFLTFLERVRLNDLEAFKHKDVPLEQIVEAVQPVRSTSYNPLFQIIFHLSSSAGQVSLPNLTVDPFPLEHVTAKLDLLITMDEAGDQLSSSFEYNRDLYEASTVRRMVEHFRCLLIQIAGRPSARLADLSMLSEQERLRILRSWNDTRVDFPENTSIHLLFEAQVASSPEAIALQAAGPAGEVLAYLSFADLNARANQLAWHLRKLGVRAELMVAVFSSRSLETITALLAILKAGGAYLPLDITYPKQRLGFMIEETATPLILTGEGLAHKLPPCNATQLCLDRDSAIIDLESRENLSVSNGGDRLAYMMYTSGSTGQPKAVQVTHCNIARLLFGVKYVRLDASTRILQTSSISFDAATFEIWGALLLGGCCVLYPERIPTVSILAPVLKMLEINTLFLTTALFNYVIDEDPECLIGVRQLLTGGEAISLVRVARAQACLPDTRLIHVYGPTESTTYASFYNMPKNFGRSLPIGSPIANTEAYILHREQPVPTGVPGELLIGGFGLARGYFKRPALTADRFIPHPFSSRLGARLYKTGDLARFLVRDENRLPAIEFLGRVDHQVKLRGFRIELGEIESLLTTHDLVSKVIVMLREDQPGNKQIVAYVKCNDSELPDPASLMRRFLEQELPEYMVPSVIVLLEEMPLTSNGKIDRAALCRKPLPESELAKAHAVPRNAVETSLAAIWSKLLNIEKISIHDNFFEKGGHSLLATKAVSRIRESFSIELPLRNLFTFPTIAELSEIVSNRIAESQLVSAPPMLPVSRDGNLPLSFAQQRLWFLDQLEGPSPTYNIPLALRFHGPFKAKLFKKCLQELLNRHESLRTTFSTVDGLAVQIIGNKARAVLPSRNLQYLNPQERLLEASRLASEEAAVPFDLVKGPLMRVNLLRLDKLDHIMLLTMHHIISDGWSMEVMTGELVDLYGAFSQGHPSPLPDLKIQYPDFAHWQRQWLSDEILEQQLVFWKNQLAQAPKLLELPTDRPRPKVQSYIGSVIGFPIDAVLAKRISALAQDCQATPFMLYLAAFNVMLARYSRQSDILVGSPIANRTRSEIEGLIGFFVNTLIFRLDLSQDPPFTALLQQLRSVALDAFMHQSLPIEQVVEALQPERSLSHSPLFQVVFNFQARQQQVLALPGLEIEPLQKDHRVAKFDLTMTIVDSGVMQGFLEFNIDLFDPATIERMAQQYCTLLTQIADHSERPLSQLSLLSQAERQLMLVDWNDSAASFPWSPSVIEQFEAWSERTPDHLALSFEDDQLCFQALNDRANRLARLLAARGVGPERIVALFSGRGLDFTSLVLAIFKLGAAYVPLGLNQPSERVRRVLLQSRPFLTLVSADALPLFTAASLDLGLDSLAIDSFVLGDASCENLMIRFHPDQLAYVMFTSGSTGLPKGAMISYRGMHNHLNTKIRGLRLDDKDIIAHDAAETFDIAVWQSFAAMIVGGHTHIFKVETAQDPMRLLEGIGLRKITIFEIVPSVLAVMLDELERGQPVPDLRALRFLMSSGEALTPNMCRRWFSFFAKVPILNMWGATECSDDVTNFFITDPPHQQSAAMALGRPTENTQVYLVDDRLQLLPIGVAGELLIAGTAVGRGYLGDGARTAMVFVPDPFCKAPGSRLYRSGDLGRFQADGNPEFLGRIDHQVKVRGFRIELGEIEAALGQSPWVAECVVIAWGDGANKRLVAYVTRAATLDIPQDSDLILVLIEFLALKLPDYMRPALIEVLDAMPLNPNGKIDRRALPDPQDNVALVTEYLAPRNATEVKLAASWAELLGEVQIGVHANFFDLGGHSLLATQVVARIREIFSVELPLRTIFEAPTIAELAERIVAVTGVPQSDKSAALKAIPRDRSFPLSFAQQRLWFLAQLDTSSDAYNVPFALILKGILRLPILERALNKITERHEVLRAYFPVDDKGLPTQAFRPVENLALRVVDLIGLSPLEREPLLQQLSVQEFKRPFQMDCGPLARHILVRIDLDTFALLSTIHHINFDGWSAGVLIQELTLFYEAFLLGKPNPLPDFQIQYADFSYWQRNWLSEENQQEQLQYWHEKLVGAPDLLAFPTDWPRPATQQFKGQTRHYPIEGADFKSKIAEFSRSSESTQFMVFKAVFAVLLYRYSGQDDVMIGSPYANREHESLEKLIGFFVNTLVFRADLGQDPSFSSFLERERRTALDAYIHQDIPFEQIVESLKPSRNLSYNALFQVMFAMQNTPEGELNLPDIALSPMKLDRDVSQFDLTMGIRENPDTFTITLQYNTSLFREQTINRFVRHYLNLLNTVIADPQQRLSQLSLLDQNERDRMLVSWNQTDVAYENELCIHHLFEQQAQRFPLQIALIFEDCQLSYRSLNARANQLACQLRSLGVRAEVAVGICLERSLELITGVLAILKAGGIYVPMDAQHPDERLNYIINDAGMPLILTDPSLASRFSSQVQPVFLDCSGWQTDPGADHQPWLLAADLDAPQHPADQNPIIPVSACNGAYLIYTSGSTGTPKGVLGIHRGLCNLSNSSIVDFGVKPGKRVMHLVSFSFDGASFLLFMALSGGSTLVLIAAEPHTLAIKACETLRDLAITHAGVPTPILTAIPFEHFPQLELILVGGEACPPDLVARWAPGRLFVNAYGPTETTVTATHSIYSSATSKPTVGKPIANIQTYILDASLEPVPQGVLAELFIGGAGVSRGYIGQPRMTAAKFVPDPFSRQCGARLYRSGDWARYLDDGEIDFLGRIDFQIKLRGYRIEPGEIEALACSFPGVAKALVMLREDQPGHKYLVAYVCFVQPDEAQEPTQNQDISKALAAFLSSRLPDYMVPAAIMPLESFPLSPNGKVHLAALPKPVQTIEETRDLTPASTPTEVEILKIWCSLLGDQNIGIHANFFELGGHSLLATQTISRIRENFPVEIPLRIMFEKPTIAQLAREIDQLHESEFILAPPILAVSRMVQEDDGASRPRSFPLSFAQQRLWFLDSLEGPSSTYNMPETLQLAGPLALLSLERAQADLIRRHEVLRTNFVMSDDEPEQLIHPPEAQCLLVIDLSQLPRGVAQLHAQQLAALDAVAPFLLTCDPLLRVHLLRLEPQNHCLLINMHHIISDGWSFELLVKDLTTAYRHQQLAEPLFAPLPVQYADFSHWQRSWLQGDVLTEMLAYWKQKLAGAPDLLQLPLDFPRPPIQTFSGTTHLFTIEPSSHRALIELSKQAQTTSFITLLAAFKVYLAIACSQDDIVVGTPIANRNRTETESLIGFFVNTLVLRNDLGGDPSFQVLLKQVRSSILDDFEHQDAPFEQVVEALQPARTLSFTPLFQIFFTYLSAPSLGKPLPGVSVQSTGDGPRQITSKFDLTLRITEASDSLDAAFEFNTNLFSAASMTRMAGHFQTLLHQLLSQPQARLSQHSLVDESERQRLLVDWNATLSPYRMQSIQAQFAAQSRRTPQATALFHCVPEQKTVLTYAVLDDKANRVAAHLKGQGIGAGTITAIYLDRSTEMVVALLAVLKTGGAYLPLDVDFPEERLRYMLEDARASLLITDKDMPTQWLAAGTNTVVLTENGVINASATDVLDELAPDLPESPAYLIYTSGSSGRPKGVVVPQQAISNYTNAILERMPHPEQGQYALVSTIAADLGHTMLYPALCCGGCLHILTRECVTDAHQFAEYFAEHQVDCLKIVPSHLAALTVSVGAQRVMPRKLLVLGGEASSGSWVTELRQAAPDCQIFNHYGPTESTVGMLTYLVQDEALAANPATLPLGQPLANTQAYISNRWLRLLPSGMPGQLSIAGEGLAHGYLHRPALTAEKFTPNPFSAKQGQRLYQTGDLARMLDGNMEFLGRIDHQVKIRGFRIELGELEAVLARHPSVAAQVVIVREDKPGEQRLLAYVQATAEPTAVEQDQDALVDTLNAYLAEKLPAFMMPNALVVLESLPLTANGKVDHRALPSPNLKASAASFVAPRTPEEEVVAQIFARIIGLEQVSIHDDFFALGGHSLMATQVISQIRKHFSLELTLRSLFKTPTVAGIVETIENLRWVAQPVDDDEGDDDDEEGLL